jgi:hypothetical protein
VYFAPESSSVPLRRTLLALFIALITSVCRTSAVGRAGEEAAELAFPDQGPQPATASAAATKATGKNAQDWFFK